MQELQVQELQVCRNHRCSGITDVQELQVCRNYRCKNYRCAGITGAGITDVQKLQMCRNCRCAGIIGAGIAGVQESEVQELQVCRNYRCPTPYPAVSNPFSSRLADCTRLVLLGMGSGFIFLHVDI